MKAILQDVYGSADVLELRRTVSHRGLERHPHPTPALWFHQVVASEHLRH
jgi:hypothetical protein